MVALSLCLCTAASKLDSRILQLISVRVPAPDIFPINLAWKVSLLPVYMQRLCACGLLLLERADTLSGCQMVS